MAAEPTAREALALAAAFAALGAFFASGALGWLLAWARA